MNRPSQNPLSMNVLLGVYLVLAMGCACLPLGAQNGCLTTRRHRVLRRHINSDLELAKIYMNLESWSEAEAHFVLAAKDPLSQKEAFAGVEQSRRRVDAKKLNDDAAPLAVAKEYEEKGIQPKAEEVYRTVSTNPAIAAVTRDWARAGIARTLDAQGQDRFFAEIKDWTDRIKEWVEFVFWVLALFAGLVVGRSIFRTIAVRRNLILLQELSAPSDEVARTLAAIFKQARVRMQNPALSPVGAMPGVLIRNLPTFNDELESIEDLEIAGSKIPFSMIARIWGEPKVNISGAFDGMTPLASIFAVIKKRGERQGLYRSQRVRTGVPNLQRIDLLNFAYDVFVRASMAHDEV